ncbi:MAG: ribonuclease [Patescibacteria group bacterium]|jgi:ribonuclease HI|nr:ribonuclease [Patescibacteria group bacterium]
MTETKRCRFDNSTLLIKSTQRTPSQLLKKYYYTAYFYCPQCQRIFHDDIFKVINKNVELFTGKESDFSHDAEVEIWTDGACSYNGTERARASWAFVSGDYEEGGFVEGKQTNNRGEAYAIYFALVWAVKKMYKKIKIHTDSQISIHGVLKDPQKVKENREIFEKIHAVTKNNNLEVEYVKVLGHSGDPNNERADKVATALVM